MGGVERAGEREEWRCWGKGGYCASAFVTHADDLPTMSWRVR
jgi:hypothetical protein